MGLAKRFESLKGMPGAQDVRRRFKAYAAFNKMLTPMAKYYASEMSMRTSNGAVAVLGGSGYMKDYPVERYLRDARITTIYEGTSQLQVVAAIAGVTGGLVPEDILAGVACDGDEALAAARARMQALGQDLADALAYVHAHPGGKAYHDLHARQLVDAAIAVVVSALFIRFAAKFPEKKAALDFWIQTRFPAARAALEQARSGFLAPVTDFERIAPLPPLTDEASPSAAVSCSFP